MTCDATLSGGVLMSRYLRVYHYMMTEVSVSWKGPVILLHHMLKLHHVFELPHMVI